MNRLALIFTIFVVPAFAMPASADGLFGLFGKRTKVNPGERVPELVNVLKSDQDERKRASAATELASYDAGTFAEIVPALVDALEHDPKTSVRMDAASSLGSIRPVSQNAGRALERSVSSDDNLRVRWHSKGILLRYRIAGYSAGSKNDSPPLAPKTTEPPLLDPAPMAVPRSVQPPVQFPTSPLPATNVSLPKTPPAKKEESLEFRPSLPRPLPQGPVFNTAVPQSPSRPGPQPLPMVDSEGPELTPLPPAPAKGKSSSPF